MVEKTTIRLDPELRDELKALGMKGETYEDVIRRLLRNSKKGQAA